MMFKSFSSGSSMSSSSEIAILFNFSTSISSTCSSSLVRGIFTLFFMTSSPPKVFIFTSSISILSIFFSSKPYSSAILAIPYVSNTTALS